MKTITLYLKAPWTTISTNRFECPDENDMDLIVKTLQRHYNPNRFYLYASDNMFGILADENQTLNN